MSEASTFEELSLDPKLLAALTKHNFVSLTNPQAQAIPAALAGKDVWLRSSTGSGKTLAYTVPLLQKILTVQSELQHDDGVADVFACVLVPTRELCWQVEKVLKMLVSMCVDKYSSSNSSTRAIEVVGTATTSTSKSKSQQAEQIKAKFEKKSYYIVVGTPTQVLSLVTESVIRLDNLSYLVIDEADVMDSFGYTEDMNNICKRLPSIYQSFLASATLSDAVKDVIKLVSHHHVTIDVAEQSKVPEKQLRESVISCGANDKYLVLFTILRSPKDCIKGKILIFVNDVDTCYRLKLFFDAFYIRSMVLHDELPQVSRFHIIHQFNRGVCDILIAADKSDGKESDNEESGVARGIDFHQVDHVVNFDVPRSVNDYVHRIGRTARMSKTGHALTLVSPDEMDVFVRIAEIHTNITALPFPSSAVSFRYRVEDQLKSIGKKRIREARVHEIEQELLKSKKLEDYFAAHPRELQALRHDMSSGVQQMVPHLRSLPMYKTSGENKKKHAVADDDDDGKSKKKHRSKEQPLDNEAEQQQQEPETEEPQAEEQQQHDEEEHHQHDNEDDQVDSTNDNDKLKKKRKHKRRQNEFTTQGTL